MNLVWDANGKLTITAVREKQPIPEPCERAGREMLEKRFQIRAPRDDQGTATAGAVLVKVSLD